MSLSLFGCGKSKLEEQAEQAMETTNSAMGYLEEFKANQEKKEKEQKEIFENKQKKIKDAEFDTFAYDGETSVATIKLKSFVILGGKYDNNADERYLVLTLDYTNNWEEDSSFGWGFETYQDGVKLSGVYGDFDKEHDTTIKSGKTIEVVCTIKLRNDTSDVEFEVNDETVYTLKIK